MSAERVTIVESGLRDGLQSLPFIVPTARKVGLVEELVAAGVREFDIASFVNPKLVPQVADSDALLGQLPRPPGVVYAGLALNERGLERALAAGADRIAVVTQTSETFSERNANCTIAESLARIARIVAAVGQGGPPVRGYISCVVDCPYEGPMAPERAADLAKQLLDLGCADVSLGETIGTATPPRVAALLDSVLAHVAPERLGVHFHDTFGQATANLVPCLERGVRLIDSSLAGIGGCPFAPGASGNVATDDVLYLLDGLGFETGIDMTEVAESGARFCAELGIAHNSKAGRGLVARARRRRAGAAD